jgi:hypothetical protein
LAAEPGSNGRVARVGRPPFPLPARIRAPHRPDDVPLRAKGFEIHPGNLVEWYVLPDALELLAGW